MIAKIEETVNLELAQVQRIKLPILEQNNTRLEVLRLDRIHPIISGNKWFKLKYSLQQALLQEKKSVVTIGGAYSNHILASACACRQIGLQSIGIIRGEKPERLSYTLMTAIDQGMKLEFLPRSAFINKDQLYNLITKKYADSYLVEEGGRNLNGINGASEILALVNKDQYDFVCCAVGSGTTMAGIGRASISHQKIIGFSSLKISNKENELSGFLADHMAGREN